MCLWSVWTGSCSVLDFFLRRSSRQRHNRGEARGDERRRGEAGEGGRQGKRRRPEKTQVVPHPARSTAGGRGGEAMRVRHAGGKLQVSHEYAANELQMSHK